MKSKPLVAKEIFADLGAFSSSLGVSSRSWGELKHPKSEEEEVLDTIRQEIYGADPVEEAVPNSEFLISNDIVSVQPMSMPTGLLYSLDYKYEEKNRGNFVKRLWQSFKTKIKNNGKK